MNDTLKYIEIDKDLIPYSFDMTFDKKTYTFEINYNAAYDFFTVDLYKDGTLIVIGEKIVYGKVLFESQQYADIPNVVTILPYDTSEKENRVTWDNLNESVFLYLLDDEGGINE